MKNIRIFDTTLRDGEQSPGCSMNTKEKVEMAKQLQKLGVDAIEAGFAASSQGDFDGVSSIAAAVKNTQIFSLSRALEKDIDVSWEAVKNAKMPGIHIFLASSDLHLEYKLKMTREQALERTEMAVKYAKRYCETVEFSAEDATRTDPEFLVKMYNIAIKAGAAIINLPDTVGYATPDEIREKVDYIIKNVNGIDRVTLSVHCHNDLGMAVANSLAAVSAGATQIECTVNGIGERAGNASLEEIAMNLYTRKEFYNASVNIKMDEIYKTSRLLQMITGISVQPNKAVVGANAFAHESGIHQHGVLSNPLTYEIFSPEVIGLKQNNMVLGKHSGKHAFISKIEQLGYSNIEADEIEKLFNEFKILADKKKEIDDRDIEALILKGKVTSIDVNDYQLEKFIITCGDNITNIASVALKYHDEVIENVSIGDGPIDAAFKAINISVGRIYQLEDFYISAVTEGHDALGTAKLRLAFGDFYSTSVGVSTDIIEACILSYLNAINEINRNINSPKMTEK